MKNLVAHSHPRESYEALRKLWTTEIFQGSAYVDAWTTEAAQRCPVLFEMTEPDIEWPHFTSYLCALALRQYDNPVVQDLYYLHELIHIGTMPHPKEIDFYSWRTQVFRNELTASMHSEVYVYLEAETQKQGLAPELRNRGFEHEIWADRFLNPRWYSFYASNKQFARERLRRERKLVSTNANPYDYIEQQIAGYFHQNIQWAEVWRDLYPRISEHMCNYVRGNIFSKDHKQWLIDNFGDKDIPFQDHAIAFAEQYQRNKEIFGNYKLAHRRSLQGGMGLPKVEYR